MSGPLEHDYPFLRITVAPPFMAGDGPYLVTRWSEPGGDQVRHHRFSATADPEAVAEWVMSLTFASLVTGPSGVRRVLARLDRSSATIHT